MSTSSRNRHLGCYKRPCEHAFTSVFINVNLECTGTLPRSSLCIKTTSCSGERIARAIVTWARSGSGLVSSSTLQTLMSRCPIICQNFAWPACSCSLTVGMVLEQAAEEAVSKAMKLPAAFESEKVQCTAQSWAKVRPCRLMFTSLAYACAISCPGRFSATVRDKLLRMKLSAKCSL